MAVRLKHLGLLGLDVPGTVATPDAVEAAYKRVQRQWHPDRHFDPIAKRLAERRFIAATEARDWLVRDAGQKPADDQRENRLKKAREQQEEGEASLEEWLKLQQVKVEEEAGKIIYNRKKDLHANYATWCNGFNPKKTALSLVPKSKEKVGRGFTNVLLRLMQKQVGKNVRQKNLIKECVNPADTNGPTYIPHLVLKK